MRYSIEPTYGFLSFAKNLDQKFIDSVKKI